jgi:hypothetical protein
MKKFNIRKTFAILGVLLIGGLTIGLTGLVPQTAEAGSNIN